MTRTSLPTCHRRSTCRVCGGSQLERFLSLGTTPLANSFLQNRNEFEAEAFFPLDVYFCTGCTLVQLLDVVNPEALFNEYIYVSGTSETMIAHFAEYARAVRERLRLEPTDLVVEIASNDGSLLDQFRAHGMRTLGIEPASNVAEIARARGVETATRFFSRQVAQEIRRERGPARLVIANNVLGHVDDPCGFLSGCRDLLDPNGMVTVEVPYLRELLDRLEYDTIYHEHLSYFSLTALARLFKSAGLSIVAIDRIAVHGGSLRVYAECSSTRPDHAEIFHELVTQEQAAGLTDLQRYVRFASDVARNRTVLLALLERLVAEGKMIGGYGAPAKGTTLLSYCQIDTRLLAFTVDKNPLKVGLYTPGSHIPVLPAAALLEKQPDYVLILAWNFADEVMRQQQVYRSRAGRFIVPIPEPAIVG